MSDRRAVIVCVDGLSPRFLGPYGNTWIDTPGINRLASESTVFQNHFADACDVQTVYRSFWYGRHAMTDSAIGDDTELLWNCLQQTQVNLRLVTDGAKFTSDHEQDEFHEVVVAPASKVSHADRPLEDTDMAKLFATAIDQIRELPEGGCLWVHSNGLFGNWDAPTDFRMMFAAEDDPDSSEIVESPSFCIEGGVDPDELLPFAHAYAGQIVLLDRCLGALLDAVRSLDGDTLLIVTSPRGFPLGEHGVVGFASDCLHSEAVHLPLFLWRTPNCKVDSGQSVRVPSFTQPPDIYQSILSWFADQKTCDSDASAWGVSLVRDWSQQQEWTGSDRACSVADNGRALFTPAWSWHASGERTPKVFAKPDDYWEANEIADRCGDVLPLLKTCVDDFQKCSQAGRRDELHQLSHRLADANQL